MFDKLDELLIRYEELMEEMNDPALASDAKRYREIMKQHAELTPVAEAYTAYKKALATIEESEEMLGAESDEEMRELLKEELQDAKAQAEELSEKIKILLLPKDPNDDRNVVMEIRAGAGGDEAALFAAELYRMYVHYAESRRWKCELVDFSEIGIGGMKYISFIISGQGAYSRLKYESGTHRVQRVPKTESGGRIHTSTATVAVMPEADEVDSDIVIDPKDIRIDVFRSSGNGGQCVNTTDSAVRLTHYPTGIVISCQDEKSQLKNRDKAMRVLRAMLYEMQLEAQAQEQAQERRSQIGTGDRSEKIRTYNFPQGRVSDHRINLTIYRIDQVMDGDLDEIIDSLIAADQAAKLANLNDEAV
ncbi:MAG: peptide chain release factor 1 [Lachnospiraceae bacterium]|nr:peptide chain release factor 1 [Lachnospiraceae bacterium]